MVVKLTPDTKLIELQSLLEFINQEYGDDTASIEIFSDLSARLVVHHDDEFAVSDNNKIVTIPENQEIHEEVEDGY